MRLMRLGAITGFSVLRSPATFLLDWSPHTPTPQRAASRDDPLYTAAMEGLYLRSERLMHVRAEATDDMLLHPFAGAEVATLHELGGVNEVAAGPLEMLSKIFEGCAEASDPASGLASRRGKPPVAKWPCRFGGVGSEDSIWRSSATWHVHGSTGLENVVDRADEADEAGEVLGEADEVGEADESGEEQQSRGSTSITLAGGVGPPSSARARGLPISGVAVRVVPADTDAAAAGIAIEFEVCFGESFEWGGGGILPGVFCNAAGQAGVGLEAMFRWGCDGLLRFRPELMSTDRRWPLRLAVRTDRRSVQLIRCKWHRLAVAVRPGDGHVSAWADGVALYESGGVDSIRFGGGESGVKLSLFRVGGSPPLSDGRVELRALRVLSAGGAMACAASARRVAMARESADALESNHLDEAVDALIAAEVTVIFAPMEWQSTGPASLEQFVTSAPPPRRLVVVIAPPLTAATEADLRSVAGVAWPNAQVDVHLVVTPTLFHNACTPPAQWLGLTTPHKAEAALHRPRTPTLLTPRLPRAIHEPAQTHSAMPLQRSIPVDVTFCTSTMTSQRAKGRPRGRRRMHPRTRLASTRMITGCASSSATPKRTPTNGPRCRSSSSAHHVSLSTCTRGGRL